MSDPTDRVKIGKVRNVGELQPIPGELEHLDDLQPVASEVEPTGHSSEVQGEPKPQTTAAAQMKETQGSPNRNIQEISQALNSGDLAQIGDLGPVGEVQPSVHSGEVHVVGDLEPVGEVQPLVLVGKVRLSGELSLLADGVELLGKLAEVRLLGILELVSEAQSGEIRLLGELASVGELVSIDEAQSDKVRPIEARLLGKLQLCFSCKGRLMDEVVPLGELGFVGKVRPSCEFGPSGELGEIRLFELAGELGLSSDLDKLRLNC